MELTKPQADVYLQLVQRVFAKARQREEHPNTLLNEFILSYESNSEEYDQVLKIANALLADYELEHD